MPGRGARARAADDPAARAGGLREEHHRQLLKRGLEHYTRTHAGAIYTFDWPVDGEVIPSPMNQDPLLLCAEPVRRAVEARLAERSQRPDTLRIEGELDPVCASGSTSS